MHAKITYYDYLSQNPIICSPDGNASPFDLPQPSIIKVQRHHQLFFGVSHPSPIEATSSDAHVQQSGWCIHTGPPTTQQPSSSASNHPNPSDVCSGGSSIRIVCSRISCVYFGRSYPIQLCGRRSKWRRRRCIKWWWRRLCAGQHVHPQEACSDSRNPRIAQVQHGRGCRVMTLNKLN